MNSLWIYGNVTIAIPICHSRVPGGAERGASSARVKNKNGDYHGMKLKGKYQNRCGWHKISLIKIIATLP
jgi:hypothetical protein